MSYAAVFKQCYMHYVFVAYRFFNQTVCNTICKLWLVRSCCLFMSLLLLSCSTVTVCTVYVAHSVSAVLYFILFADGLFLNAWTKMKLQLQLLFCIVVVTNKYYCHCIMSGARCELANPLTMARYTRDLSGSFVFHKRTRIIVFRLFLLWSFISVYKPFFFQSV